MEVKAGPPPVVMSCCLPGSRRAGLDQGQVEKPPTGPVPAEQGLLVHAKQIKSEYFMPATAFHWFEKDAHDGHPSPGLRLLHTVVRQKRHTGFGSKQMLATKMPGSSS